MLKVYNHPGRFELENGGTIENLRISFTTHGTLNADGSNVVWVCHALTANADPLSWWPGVVGVGCAISPDEYFIVCANIIGSCYGSTAATKDFPLVTIRDMVNAHILLRKHLSIEKIALLMGGSMGGYQALEWALTEPLIIDSLFLIATSAKETAWGIAIHTAQRMALESDPVKGLATARAIGMLTYRNYEAFVKNQSETSVDKLLDFKAESYLRYQGDKLVKRFTPESYYALSRSMDTHNIARNRSADVPSVLKTIQQRALIMGICSDHLCPVAEQKLMAEHIPGAQLVIIDSDYGHDGFLVESRAISNALNNFLKKSVTQD